MNNDKQATRDLTREAFEFLQTGDHVKVVFGALKKLHISKQNPFYEDMVRGDDCLHREVRAGQGDG